MGSSRKRLGSLLPILLVAAILSALFAATACSRESSAGSSAAIEAPIGVWWAGDGAFVVAQFSAEDGRGVVIVWDKRVGKTLEPQEGYRVVAVEKAAPRIWLVPEEDFPAKGETGTALDIAGDTRDEKPERLLIWDLGSAEGPSDAGEARWAAWPGSGGYTAYPEVDVLKGSLVSRLLFQPSSGETEGSKADVPEDMVTLDPIGWSDSGRYFAAVGLGPDEAQMLVFEAASGSLVASETVAAPSSGGVHAAWGTESDGLHWFHGDEFVVIAAPDWVALPYAPASSYRPRPGSGLLGMTPAGALIWQASDESQSEEGVYVFADPESGGQTRQVMKADKTVAYDGMGGLAAAQSDPLRLLVQPLEGTAETVWAAE